MNAAEQLLPPHVNSFRKALAVMAVFVAFVPAADSLSQPVGMELHTLRDDTVTVMYHPGDEAVAASVAALAAGLHVRIRQDLNLRASVPVTVYLLRDSTYDRVKRDALPPRWIAGTADASRRFIVLRLYPGRSSMDYSGTLAHELTHVIVEEDYPRHNGWPLWFREGLAMRQSGSEGFSHGKALFLSGFSGGLIPLSRLAYRFPENESRARLAYAESYSVIAFLHRRYGRRAFTRFLHHLRVHDFETAFHEAYGMDLSGMESAWRTFVNRRYSWIPMITGASTFWFLCVAVFFLSLAARRKKTLAIRRRWEEEETGTDIP